MPRAHRFIVTVHALRPIRSATSASVAVPSSASSSAVQEYAGPRGLGMPSASRLSRTAFGVRPVLAAASSSAKVPCDSISASVYSPLR
jgi:hypothetical protein